MNDSDVWGWLSGMGEGFIDFALPRWLLIFLIIVVLLFFIFGFIIAKSLFAFLLIIPTKINYAARIYNEA